MNSLIQIFAISLAAIPVQSRQTDAAARVGKWIEANVSRGAQLRSSATPVEITDPEVKWAFPGETILSLHFREFPVAMMPPNPLGSRNLFAVDKDGTVHLLTNPGQLEKFSVGAMAPAKDAAQLRSAGIAWLRLSQEYSQDGFFRFSIPAQRVKVTLPVGKVTAAAVVDPKGGDRGEINATLSFRKLGSVWKLQSVKEVRTVQPGVRPICQATKLLDPDPIVRRMAERDILVMGLAAKNYLFEQRSYASPELRKAIDRIWARVLAGER